MSRNLNIIKSSYAAGAKGDPAGILADFAEDATWQEMAGTPYSGVYRGPQAVIQNVFARLGADWAPFTCSPESYHDAGNVVVVTGTYSGSSVQTGKSFTARFAHVWTLKDGKITAFEQFTDTAMMRAALAL